MICWSPRRSRKKDIKEAVEKGTEPAFGEVMKYRRFLRVQLKHSEPNSVRGIGSKQFCFCFPRGEHS